MLLGREAAQEQAARYRDKNFPSWSPLGRGCIASPKDKKAHQAAPARDKSTHKGRATWAQLLTSLHTDSKHLHGPAMAFLGQNGSRHIAARLSSRVREWAPTLPGPLGFGVLNPSHEPETKHRPAAAGSRQPGIDKLRAGISSKPKTQERRLFPSLPGAPEEQQARLPPRGAESRVMLSSTHTHPPACWGCREDHSISSGG